MTVFEIIVLRSLIILLSHVVGVRHANKVVDLIEDIIRALEGKP